MIFLDSCKSISYHDGLYFNMGVNWLLEPSNCGLIPLGAFCDRTLLLF